MNPRIDAVPPPPHDEAVHTVTIVGVLNVTPDSFHDGGRFLDPAAAVAQALALRDAGADIVEVGGESTGPNSPAVSPEEELKRVLPVIRAVRAAAPDLPLSVDTYKAAVARAALEAGVAMINDVTAGRSDPELFAVVAKSDAKLVLMYSKDPSPRTTIAENGYDDVVSTIAAFLAARRDAAIAAGVPLSRIILDPGMGHFVSSDARWSLELLGRLPELTPLGCPLLLSPSRKSFLAGTEKLRTADRLPGTIAASAIAALHGAAYIRTHDVLEVRRGCEIASAVRTFTAGRAG